MARRSTGKKTSKKEMRCFPLRLAKKNMGLGLVCLAALFLFNPTVSVVDVLPDCIGYIILYFALRKLADINDHVETAITYTKRMIIVSIAQLLSILVLFGMVSEPEKPTTYLLFSFVVSVFEIVFLPKLYGEFFEGLTYLASRKDGTAVLAHSSTDRMSRLTVFFVIAKAFFAALPEFSSLVVGTDSRWRFLYNYIGMFRTVAILIILPFGIYWLYRIYQYIGRVSADRPFIERLEETYEKEVLPKEEIFVQRSVSVAFVVMSIGICFALDLYVDNQSILPDFLSPLLLIVSLLLLRKHIQVSGAALWFCGANFVSSAVTYIGNYYFHANYTLLLTRISADAYDAYLSLGIVKALDSVLFFLMLFTIFPSLQAMVVEHTGFSPILANNIHRDDKIRYVHETLNKRLSISRTLALICALSSPIVFFCTRILYIAKHSSFLWMLELLICSIFSIYFIKTLFAIKREIGYKYLLS